MEDTNQSPQAVTAVVDREVLPGKKEAFEEALKGIIEASRGFDGYLGTDVTFPETANDNHYRVMFRYESLEQLKAWEKSPERLHWLNKIDKLIKEPSQLNVICGLETWFALPRAKSIVPPKQYKMAVVVWLAITPLLIAFNLIVQPWYGHLGMVPRILATTPIVVLIMTYLLMPFMTKIFAWWLYPKPRG